MKEGRNSNSGHWEALSNEEVRIGNHGARKNWPEKKVSDVGCSINIRQWEDEERETWESRHHDSSKNCKRSYDYRRVRR